MLTCTKLSFKYHDMNHHHILHPKIHSNHKGFLLPTALSKYIQKPVNTPDRVESINTEVCATTIGFHLILKKTLFINTAWVQHMHIY